MNSSHIPDGYGIGNAVDIACTTSKYRYELIQVVQKFFNRIGISGGAYGGVLHLDVDREKVQEVMWLYLIIFYYFTKSYQVTHRLYTD